MLQQSELRPWPLIDQALHTHLAGHQFILTRRDADDGDTLTSLSWDFMGRKLSKGGQVTKVTYQGGTAGPASFTVDFLCKQALKVELETNPTDIPFIFLGQYSSVHLPKSTNLS